MRDRVQFSYCVRPKAHKQRERERERERDRATRPTEPDRSPQYPLTSIGGREPDGGRGGPQSGAAGFETFRLEGRQCGRHPRRVVPFLPLSPAPSINSLVSQWSISYYWSAKRYLHANIFYLYSILSV